MGLLSTGADAMLAGMREVMLLLLSPQHTRDLEVSLAMAHVVLNQPRLVTTCNQVLLPLDCV